MSEGHHGISRYFASTDDFEFVGKSIDWILVLVLVQKHVLRISVLDIEDGLTGVSIQRQS